MALWSRSRRRFPPSAPAPSVNRASSFHLWWHLPMGSPVVEVAAVVEIVTPPSVDALYFWALQVGFATDGRVVGAGHTGLQWHPSAPGGAVNWGGYDETGRQFDGTKSPLPEVDSANTVRWPWRPGRPYRFTISRSDPGRWRSVVTDLGDGRRVSVRDLAVEATELTTPVIWTEMFARCEDAAVVARWSQLEARRADGSTVSPTELTTSYQDPAAGGCPNTESRVDGSGVVQITGLARPRSGRPGESLAYRPEPR